MMATPLDVTLVGIVGGPGSGKGTQCSRLAKSLNLEHLSIGDVLRAEMADKNNPHAQTIKDNMTAGRVGPPHLTVGLLKKRILAAMERGIQTFVLDGTGLIFTTNKSVADEDPGWARNTDQCTYLEREIAPVKKVIVLECGDEVLMQRLAAAQRDRFDDNADNIQRRIDTFRETTSKVIDAFEAAGKVTRIDGERDVEAVHRELLGEVQAVMKT
ncbi:Uridylate kinase [Fulvia fulva]|uniref:Uridylate kinase n=1 Tax=Passalora fulva TaxID=5499 RepID=A0A9Q8UR45_PASFU|nr:Uridylate kinase [Fulvia fulva]KAK4621954.1 Uridylate kinase [Fulvia fulva]KAK4622712.1 Uridylate kinase [Fulvia fulva]UJO19373.1 Uridylate kinase [Fulvia fulva]WPV16798.1 Uridylate kinase [Fulvia fulva]WPV31055.1 Uridylate kinase [Fulvia fulva]